MFSGYGIILDMLHRHDENCLDTWLLLLRDFDGNAAGVVNTNYELLAEGLGMLKDIKHPFYRRDINELLRHLNRLYKLVEIDIRLNQPVKVKLLRKPEGESFSLPRAYWDYGWANRLDLNAKACLLINLAQLGHNPRSPEWSLARPQLTEKYGIGMNSLYRGMKALRDFNIIGFRSFVTHNIS